MENQIKIASNQVVMFSLGAQRCALDFSAVERVVHIVDITPVPRGPDILAGVINVHGHVLPVLDLRGLVGLPSKGIALSDQMIIARASGLRVAILTDHVIGVAEYKEQDIDKPEKIFPGIEYLEGVVKLADGMVFVYDLDRFLSSSADEIIESLPTGLVKEA